MDITEKLIANHKFYDLILAHDDKVLRECPNAQFLTESCCSWMPYKSGNMQDKYGTMNYGDGILHKNPVVPIYEGCDVSKKEMVVSFLTSSKRAASGHLLRQEIFDRLPERVGELAVWKHRSPPVHNDKRTILEPYKFHISVENSKHNGYYSEKIVDCFIAKTVPFYWGCPNIGEFFNPNGIITFENYEDLQAKMSSVTPETYSSMLTAVEENFHTALRSVHQWDLIEAAISHGIARKHAQPRTEVATVGTTPGLSRRPLRRP